MVVTLPDGRKSGSFPEFMSRVFKNIEVELEYQPISERSLAQFPLSRFSACYHEIALNRTDVCVGNFWSTPERRLMPGVSMSQDLLDDEFFVISKRASSLSFAEIVALPFKPFSWELWLVIVSVMVASSLFFRLIEDLGLEFDDKGGSRSDTGDGEGAEGVPKMPLWVKLMDSIYMTVMSFVNSSMEFTPLSSAGRIFNFALGFVFLFLVASYTANLAKSLVVRQAQGEVTSIENAILRQIKVCGFSSATARIVAKLPAIQGLYVESSNALDALERFDRGECGAALINGRGWESASRGVYTPEAPRQHCDKIATRESVLSLGNAVPMRVEMAESLSFAISQSFQEGWIEVEDRLSMAAHWPASQCGGVASADEGLRVIDVAGLFIILGFVLCLCVALAALSRVRQLVARSQNRTYRTVKQMHLEEQSFQQAFATGGRRVSSIGAAGKAIARARADTTASVTRGSGPAAVAMALQQMSQRHAPSPLGRPPGHEAPVLPRLRDVAQGSGRPRFGNRNSLAQILPAGQEGRGEGPGGPGGGEGRGDGGTGGARGAPDP